MTGQVHWLPLALVLLGALPFLYYSFRSWRDDGAVLVEQSTVRCRQRGNQLVHCTVVRDAATGQPMGIRSCSAISGVVSCNKACLSLFAHAA